jgi:flagellar hook assembly protein FlgD
VYDLSGSLLAVVFEGQVPGTPEPVYLADNPFIADGVQSAVVRSASGNVQWVWNGKESGGALMQPGVYILQSQWQSLSDPGLKEVADTSFTILSQASLVRRMILAPNPAGSQGEARLIWPPDARADRIGARVYNLAGELVMEREVPSVEGSMTWNMRSHTGQLISNGTYVWAVEVLGSQGQVVERGMLKMAVVWAAP